MDKINIELMWQELWFMFQKDKGEHIRFELGGEEFGNIEQPIPRFLQAFNRAVAVADEVFSKDLIGVVAEYPQDKIRPFWKTKMTMGFEALKKTGFDASQISTWNADIYHDHEWQPAQFEMRSYDLSGSKSNRNCMIWHSIAGEMPIEPASNVIIWLIDLNSEMMLHIYDDRGLDVMALNTKDLQPIHDRFDDWLLDYDRERMSKLF